MTNLTKAAREALIDTDGENLAVRAFLALYGTSTPTAEGMAAHLRMSGFDVVPEWVKDSPGHLTKSGAQDWLRRLFALESALSEAPGESAGLPPLPECYVTSGGRDLWSEEQMHEYATRAMLAARPSVPQGAGLAYSQDAAEEIQTRAYAVGFAAGRSSAPTVALTDEQVVGLYVDLNTACHDAPTPSSMFAIIVRAVERAHGIGKEGGA